MGIYNRSTLENHSWSLPALTPTQTNDFVRHILRSLSNPLDRALRSLQERILDSSYNFSHSEPAWLNIILFLVFQIKETTMNQITQILPLIITFLGTKFFYIRWDSPPSANATGIPNHLTISLQIAPSVRQLKNKWSSVSGLPQAEELNDIPLFIKFSFFHKLFFHKSPLTNLGIIQKKYLFTQVVLYNLKNKSNPNRFNMNLFSSKIVQQLRVNLKCLI
jgi:hypothetical protein